MDTYTAPANRRGQPPLIEDTGTVDELVKFLVGEQERTCASDASFAETLGVSRPYWNNVKASRQGLRPGPRFLKGVIDAYPEWADRIRGALRPEIAAIV